MKQLAVCLLGVALTGCVINQYRLEDKFNPNIGRHIDDVIARLGEPNRTYVMPDGRKAYEFDLSPIVEARPTMSTGNISPFSAKSSAGSAGSCLVSFVVNADRVVQEWHAEGGGC